MAALAQDRNTPSREGDIRVLPVAAATTIHQGAIVMHAAGIAQPGATALALVAVGRAEEAVDNAAGAEGDLSIKVRKGVYRYDNAAADPITTADIGSTAYVVDDQTVARTDGTNTRSPAGPIFDVDDVGVWVAIG